MRVLDEFIWENHHRAVLEFFENGDFFGFDQFAK